MRKCKDYKIYKFNVVISKKEGIKNLSKDRWARAQESTQFKIKLINTLAPENFEALSKYTLFAKPLGLKMEEYVSPRGHYTSDAYEIGLDMLHTKYGLLMEHHWSYTYYFVPLNQPELLEFFENNKPSWVTNVKRI